MQKLMTVLLLCLLLLGATVPAFATNEDLMTVCADTCWYLNTTTSDLVVYGRGLYVESPNTDVFLSGLYELPVTQEVDIYTIGNPQIRAIALFTQETSYREGPLWFDDHILASLSLPNEQGLVIIYHGPTEESYYVMPFADMQRTCAADTAMQGWLDTCGNHPYTVYLVPRGDVDALLDELVQ